MRTISRRAFWLFAKMQTLVLSFRNQPRHLPHRPPRWWTRSYRWMLSVSQNEFMSAYSHSSDCSQYFVDLPIGCVRMNWVGEKKVFFSVLKKRLSFFLSFQSSLSPNHDQSASFLPSQHSLLRCPGLCLLSCQLLGLPTRLTPPMLPVFLAAPGEAKWPSSSTQRRWLLETTTLTLTPILVFTR